MPSPDLNPDWVLSNSSSENKARPLQNDAELTVVASRLWPRVQAHARRELANRNSDDGVVLAAEVWEGVLQSVSRTRQRRKGKGPGILDLEAYLFGVFHHRFNRALKKERRRLETIELVPSTRDLEQLPGAQDAKSSRDLEHSIQVKEIVQNMDDWTRRVWAAKQYGYSWREIAEYVGLGEQAAKARFHNALRKIAARLGYGK
jgi:DNA-directed RNA polymerase specialized sigma24 family protein